jgi:hypothetical protein
MKITDSKIRGLLLVVMAKVSLGFYDYADLTAELRSINTDEPVDIAVIEVVLRYAKEVL